MLKVIILSVILGVACILALYILMIMCAFFVFTVAEIVAWVYSEIGGYKK